MKGRGQARKALSPLSGTPLSSAKARRATRSLATPPSTPNGGIPSNSSLIYHILYSLYLILTGHSTTHPFLPASCSTCSACCRLQFARISCDTTSLLNLLLLVTNNTVSW